MVLQWISGFYLQNWTTSYSSKHNSIIIWNYNCSSHQPWLTLDRSLSSARMYQFHKTKPKNQSQIHQLLIRQREFKRIGYNIKWSVVLCTLAEKYWSLHVRNKNYLKWTLIKRILCQKLKITFENEHKTFYTWPKMAFSSSKVTIRLRINNMKCRVN